MDLGFFLTTSVCSTTYRPGTVLERRYSMAPIDRIAVKPTNWKCTCARTSHSSLKAFIFFVGLSTCISICTVAELSLNHRPQRRYYTLPRRHEDCLDVRDGIEKPMYTVPSPSLDSIANVAWKASHHRSHSCPRAMECRFPLGFKSLPAPAHTAARLEI